jgi:transcriptional regulator with XRE-family HTH domain
MDEKEMTFGEYIKHKRKSRELTISEVADYIGATRSFLCDVENGRRTPLKNEKMELFARFLHLSEEETALLFDLASKNNRLVPYDIMDTFLSGQVGELARTALRLSKECNEPEAEWKQLIRQLEDKKAENVRKIREGTTTDD